MDSTTGAMVVAVIGVTGTLLSPLMTNWILGRNRREEQVLSLTDRRETWRHEQERSELLERRACYIALNTTSRDYHNAMRTISHAIERGDESIESDRARLAQAREIYRIRYSEAQMVVSDDVLDVAREVNAMLAIVYRMIRRLDERVNETGETPAAARSALDAGWIPLRRMRYEMRKDLGVGDRLHGIEPEQE